RLFSPATHELSELVRGTGFSALSRARNGCPDADRDDERGEPRFPHHFSTPSELALLAPECTPGATDPQGAALGRSPGGAEGTKASHPCPARQARRPARRRPGAPRAPASGGSCSSPADSGPR